MLCFSATLRVTKKRNKHKKQAVFIQFMTFKQAACADLFPTMVSPPKLSSVAVS